MLTCIGLERFLCCMNLYIYMISQKKRSIKEDINANLIGMALIRDVKTHPEQVDVLPNWPSYLTVRFQLKEWNFVDSRVSTCQ